MRALLDTSVILTAALNQQSHAYRLHEISHAVQFLITPKIRAECTSLIKSRSNSEKKISATEYLIEQFLLLIRAHEIDDNDTLTPTKKCKDPNDQFIFDAAVHANCDYICTYNCKDFPKDKIKIAAPLYILRDNLCQNISLLIQHPKLSSKGTLLFIGQLHHKSSIGSIIKSKNGTEVYADGNGHIQISGITNTIIKNPLPEGERMALSIRYHKGHFYADNWKNNNNSWKKTPLTEARCDFPEDTQPQLFFVAEHNFYGHVINVSGADRFVKDGQMEDALENVSLGATIDSFDVKHGIENLEIVTTINGCAIRIPKY
ncbi:PIN domain-containing protein [Rhodobacteraceae bacterium CH30]|nr:PIN domain-containing protein [Rhodobacteraceae bacterium CH30]